MPIQVRETGGNPNAKGWTRRDLVTFLHHRGYTMKLLGTLTGRGAAQLSALLARHAENATMADVNGGGQRGSDEGILIPHIARLWIVESVKAYMQHEQQVSLGHRRGEFNPLPMPEPVRDYFHPGEKRSRIAKEKEAKRGEIAIENSRLVAPYADGRPKENLGTREWMVKNGFTIAYLAENVFHVSTQAVEQRLSRKNGLRLNVLLNAFQEAGIEY